jgi:hypothetical protein
LILDFHFDMRISGRYSITIKDAKGLPRLRFGMGMIGAPQSLNYHPSTADDFGAPALLNPSATPDPQVQRRACTHINRRAAARHGPHARANENASRSRSIKTLVPVDVLDFDDALWVTSDWFDRMDAGRAIANEPALDRSLHVSFSVRLPSTLNSQRAAPRRGPSLDPLTARQLHGRQTSRP